MLKIIQERIRQKHRTVAFPKGNPLLPDRLRGVPDLDASRCPDGCRECVQVCPTDAIQLQSGSIQMDLGKCLFCPQCAEACPQGAIRWTQDWRLAVSAREHLLYSGESFQLAKRLEEKMMKVLGRSLKLRQVSAGGCNACEADVNVLNTVVFDLGRFGVQVVASPRHADGVLVTGPVPENMKLGLEKTWQAIPTPKIAIAVGACAISGGPFAGHPEVHNGADSIIPIDLYIPGCPPHPITILDGLLRVLGKLE